MPVTFEWRDEPEHPQTFEANVNGYEGKRWALVTGVDRADQAVNPAVVPGVPVVGDPWSLEYPDVLCAKVGPVQRGGGLNSGTRVGWCYVPVEYATPSPDNGVLPTDPGKKWTEISASSGSLTIARGIGPDFDTVKAINNGQGFNAELGIIQFTVVRNWDLGGDFARAQVLSLAAASAFNDAPVTLPPLVGDSLSLPFAAETLQFTGFSAEVVGRSRRVSLFLRFGLKPTYVTTVYNDKGVPLTGSEFTSRVYKKMSFAGIW